MRVACFRVVLLRFCSDSVTFCRNARTCILCRIFCRHYPHMPNYELLRGTLYARKDWVVQCYFLVRDIPIPCMFSLWSNNVLIQCHVLLEYVFLLWSQSLKTAHGSMQDWNVYNDLCVLCPCLYLLLYFILFLTGILPSWSTLPVEIRALYHFILFFLF